MVHSSNPSESESPSPASPYAVAVVKNLPRSLEDEVTAILFGSGAAGVAEDLKFVQHDLRYDPEIVASQNFVLNAYFVSPLSDSERMALERDLRALQIDGLQINIEVQFRNEEQKDWLEEWKKGFAPFQFAGPFWIVPHWCEIPAQVKSTPEYVLLMEPGMAFGTGTHETTQLAARHLVDLANEKKVGAAEVLDVGTGTGVLALLTERMGAKAAVGLDIDPEARRTARENLELNRAQRTTIDDRELRLFLREEPKRFDIVIANIIDGVLLILAKDLREAVKPGGKLLLSGILTDREDEFHRDFAAQTGLREIRRHRQGEWCSSLWCE